jgi:Sigma-70 region 2
MRPIAGPGGGDALARAFEAQRPRLVRVAYATVGSVAEAEDCVQEAWPRLRRVGDPAEIRDLGAWLTTARPRADATGLERQLPGKFARRPGSAKVLTRTPVSAGDARPALQWAGTRTWLSW